MFTLASRAARVALLVTLGVGAASVGCVTASTPTPDISATKESASKIVIPGRVFFDEGSLLPAKNNEPVFGRLAEILKARPKWFLVVETHSETREGINSMERMNLSKKRGEAIVTKLVALGIDPNRLRVLPTGDTKPTTAGETDDERALNRSAKLRAELEDGSAP